MFDTGLAAVLLAEIQPISYLGLAFVYLIMLFPIAIVLFLKLKMFKDIFIAVIRMSVQLFLIGFVLIALFKWNNAGLNVLWLFIMVLFATFSVFRNSNLRVRYFTFPILFSLMTASFLVIMYFNGLILGIQNVFDAKYLIVLSGMILGNSMRGTIVALNSFYKDIHRNEDRYFYQIAHGATIFEAVKPYFRSALKSALRPNIAVMSTLGIVSLPGMMAGQILGGASTEEAIKYQIAVMTAIFTSVSLTVGSALLLTMRTSFDDFGILRKNIFKMDEN